MDYLKLTGIIVGATGFWKLVDTIIKWRSDKILKSAEANNFFAMANKEVVTSFLQLSQELKDQIQRQKERIDELEKLVAKLEKHNCELEAELNKLKNVKSIGQ